MDRNEENLLLLHDGESESLLFLLESLLHLPKISIRIRLLLHSIQLLLHILILLHSLLVSLNLVLNDQDAGVSQLEVLEKEWVIVSEIGESIEDVKQVLRDF